MVVVGQRHAPAASPPGKTRCPLYRRLGVPQGRSVRVRKISPHRAPDRPARSDGTFLHLYVFKHTYVYFKEREMSPKPLSPNVKEKDDLGDINADGREIFTCINLREVECKAVDWIQQTSDTINP